MSDSIWLWRSSILLGAIALALLLWALFADRSRGRRRCGRCWYDMAGVPGLTCPECGRAARSERALFRTRRRWRTAAAAALVGLSAVITTSAPRVRADGWGAIVPLPLLEGAARLLAGAAADAYTTATAGVPPNNMVKLTRPKRWTRVLLASEVARRSAAAQVVQEPGPRQPIAPPTPVLRDLSMISGFWPENRAAWRAVAHLAADTDEMRRALAPSCAVWLSGPNRTGTTDDARMARELVDRLVADPSWRVRSEAVAALISFGPSDPVMVRRVLTIAAVDDDPGVRERAASSLAFGVRGPLYELLRDPDPLLRVEVIRALVRNAESYHVLHREHLDGIAPMLTDDPDPRVRRAAAEALFRRPWAAPIIEAAAATETDPAVASILLMGRAMAADVRDQPALVAKVLQGGSGEHLSYAIAMIERLGRAAAETAPALADLAVAGGPHAADAVDALLKVGPTGAAALVRVMTDGPDDMRGRARDLLRGGLYLDHDAFDTLAAALDHTDPRCRADAATILPFCHNHRPAALTALERHADDPDPDARAAITASIRVLRIRK